MTLIVCADEQGGLLFHNRRLSRDSEVCKHILDFCGDKPLWMNSYSATIFPLNTPNIRVSEKFLEEAGEGEFCFAENTDFSSVFLKAKRVVIYRWNRNYPSNVKLQQKLLSERNLVSKVDFPGNSHPCITQEVYEL